MLEGDRGAGGGSSPHTRGARVSLGAFPLAVRIIPAYAGSTSRPGTSAGGPSDHPRIRGEHHSAWSEERIGGGSSPHTRGARAGQRRERRPGRIIPAYAGSTLGARRYRCGPWDHPRIRGEHLGGALHVSGARGSSPHTRGALGCRALAPNLVGIIPAYAGSTASKRSSTSSSRDHPRIRGEHVEHLPTSLQCFGSSPHTRGALGPLERLRRRRRIIPAYAGSTT